MPVKSPLVRNIDIVVDAQLLVATPPTAEELRRSGTWHTVREARRRSVPSVIVWPDGSVKCENFSDLELQAAVEAVSCKEKEVDEV